MAQERQYLAVPYEEREAARAAGARWDTRAKSWYAGEGGDRQKLARWMISEKATTLSPRDEFIAAMSAHGLLAIDGHPIGDGKSHRVPVESDKKGPGGRYIRPSGRYSLHLDGHPAGYVRNFKNGTYASWKSSGFRMQPHERAALRAEVAERKQKHAGTRSRAIEEAALNARQRTASLIQATEPTGYMSAKGIRPTRGALTDGRGLTTYLPAIDIAGKQWTLQTIRQDGRKLFVKGSRKEGTFHVVDGDLAALGTVRTLIVAEGYATAVILKEATGEPTIAAFDAGNLRPVVTALRAQFPDKPILIAGDDDHGVEMREGHNPGREKAGIAAATVDGSVVFPRFAPGEQENDPKGFTDFHDLATRSRLGRDGVQTQLDAALLSLARPAADQNREAGASEISPGPAGRRPRRRVPKSPSPASEMSMPPLSRAEQKEPGSAAESPVREGKVGPQRSRKEEDNGVLAVSGRSSDVGDVPASLRARYRIEHLKSQYDYYESYTAERPVFHDRGDRLLAETDSPAIIADMIEIAAHRGWQSIEVRGSAEFRREVWLQAKAADIEVSGYTPRDRDVQEANARIGSNAMARPTGNFDGATKAAPGERLYLSVPFAEKDQAKAAGARWDRNARSWFVEETGRSSVARWLPTPDQARADRMISGDRAAREQMRTIEAVVTATLGEDPAAARRVLDTGRQELAGKVARGESIASPQLRPPERARGRVSSPEEPGTPARRPRERFRSR